MAFRSTVVEYQRLCELAQGRNWNNPTQERVCAKMDTINKLRLCTFARGMITTLIPEEISLWRDLSMYQCRPRDRDVSLVIKWRRWQLVDRLQEGLNYCHLTCVTCNTWHGTSLCCDIEVLFQVWPLDLQIWLTLITWHDRWLVADHIWHVMVTDLHYDCHYQTLTSTHTMLLFDF